MRVIRAEHDALSAMLRPLPLVLDAQRRAGTAPDFVALRAMLFDVDEFPERLHHKKESELLLPKLRALAPSAATWAGLDEAFGSRQDALAPHAGQPVDAAYAPLRQRVLAALA